MTDTVSQNTIRVITGTARGARLIVPLGATPISDRAKTVLFDVIGQDIKGKTVLDLFAGSGCLGIESLSRGATHATFIESSKDAVATIHNNLANTNLTSQATVHPKDALHFIRHTKDKYDIVFADPPYAMYSEVENLPRRLLHDISEIIPPGGAAIVKHPTDQTFDTPKQLSLADTREFGATTVSIWVKT